MEEKNASKCPKCHSCLAKEMNKQLQIIELGCPNCFFYTSRELHEN